ncbi:MAG: methyltransferase domain-containing protein [Ktedonobacteraceae bacterium]|nr:methyltransferase domain-containing protein [Ktedonobacteraceae bacterium]
MSTEADRPQSGYQVDAENMAEMARLTRQARMLTEHLGLLPSSIKLPQRSTILDIGCGPGEWVLETAQSAPQSLVIGIDISQLMINYALFTAELENIMNARFQVMDAQQPLAFSDAYFDIIHARFITGFQSTATWPPLLNECFRLLRPGGTLCCCEFEDIGISTSPHLTRYNSLLIQAARLAGQCFTPSGDHYGITAVQPRLLRMAGFQNIQREAYTLDFSTGSQAHNAMYENFKTFLKLLQPFLIRSEVTTAPEIEVLYERTLEDMQADDFCAIANFQTVWGSKP